MSESVTQLNENLTENMDFSGSKRVAVVWGNNTYQGQYFSSMIGIQNADKYNISIDYATTTGEDNTKSGRLMFPKIRYQNKVGISFVVSDSKYQGRESTIDITLSKKDN